ncbi:MAG: MFS transporter [Candidatus Nanopelagicales bacterium]
MTATAASAIPDRRPPRSTLVLSALILGAVAANMNLGIANVALPSISRELGATQGQLTAVANAFTLGLACSVLYFGAIGDRYGRKLLFKLGAALSVPTALVSAFAPSVEVLMAGRFLSGLAAGLLFPTTLSMVSALYSGRAQTRAIALWSGIGGGFAALGPLIGGFLLTSFWWGSVFLITVPLVAIDLVLGWWVLPKRSGEDATSVDHKGGVLSVVAVASLVLALQSIAGYRWALVIGLAVVSVAAFWLFLRQQRRAPRPLIDLDDAKATTFWVAAVAGTVTFGSLMGMLFIGQQFTQNVMGYSALQAATYQLPVSVMMILTSLPAARLVARFGGRVTLAAGLLVAALAFVWILAFWRPGAVTFHIVFAYALVGVGVGLAITPASKALMASLPASRAGMGSAFTDLTRDFGGSVMNAIMGTALAVAYGAAITSDLKGLSPQQSAALGDSAAQQMVSSYEGAASVAERYQEPISGQIVDAAASAFSEGKEVAVSLALLFTLASVVLVLVKYPRKPAEFDFFAKIEQENEYKAAAQATSPAT